MAEIDKNFPASVSEQYTEEMGRIKKSLSQYPGHKSIASSLGKYISQEIVAGLIGCIIPESDSDHTILNAAEFNGNGTSGTEGWNCGEGLIQWTYWKYKLPLIKKYNDDSRSTQKLPTTWEQYKLGTPISKGKRLFAVSDGRHIAGLSLDNQMLFLVLYYDSLIKKLKDEKNIPTIVAKIYQQKAGIGIHPEIQDPVIRAYETSKDRYPAQDNHYLQSLKIALEYLGAPIPPSSVPVTGDYVTTDSSAGSSSVPHSNTVKEMSGMTDESKPRVKGMVLGYHMKQK